MALEIFEDTFYPLVVGDDTENGISVEAANIGYDSAGPGNISYRFPAVTVPATATIVTATFTAITAYERSGSPVLTKVYANAVDDAVAPTNGGEYNLLARTTAFVEWNNMEAINPAGFGHTSPGIVTVIQEVIDRPGWAAGNALQIIWEDAGSARYDYRAIAMMELGSAAALSLAWTVPTAVDDVASWNNLDTGSNITFTNDFLTATHE
jgi:hypothetical protein